MVIPLLIAPARHVIGKDPATVGIEVVAGKERHDRESLHCHAEIAAQERGQPIRLAVQRERDSLNLFVVFEFDLEKPHHLDGNSRGTSDTDDRVLICRENLFDVPLRDDVAHRCSTIPRHDDAIAAGESDDRRAMRHCRHALHGVVTRRRRPAVHVHLTRHRMPRLCEEFGEGGSMGHEVSRQTATQRSPPIWNHCPPFWTKDFTNSSAFSSRTSSISSRIASTSESKSLCARSGRTTSSDSVGVERSGRRWLSCVLIPPP